MNPDRRAVLFGAALAPLAGAARASPSGDTGDSAFTFADSHVHEIPETDSGRPYQAWVDLPPGYSDSDAHRYPAVYVADAPYAFPLLHSLRPRVGQGGRNIEDFVLVGLAPPRGEQPVHARMRDYTPTNPLTRKPKPGEDYGGTLYGEASRYLRYVRRQLLPFVESKYRIDPARRVFLGHSYGSLFGAQALFEAPDTFRHYILGSPSLWFDDHVTLRREADYAGKNKDLDARVRMYCGSFEAVSTQPRFNRHNDLIRDMQLFERTLKRRKYPSLVIDGGVIADEDHLTVAPAIATRGLLWALPGRGPYDPG